MRRLRTIISVFGIMLLILSAASVYTAMRGLSEIHPAESYEDQGVRTFAPYDVLPVQVKNTGTSRDRRMNPTRTVYMVYYLATDGSGYQWSDEVLSRDYGKEVVKAGETVKRRVLSIPEDRTYITVEPGQTAGSYTAGLRDRYTGMIVLGTLYILFYLLVLLISRILRHLRRSRAEDAELDRAAAPSHAEFFGPEILEEKRRFHPGKILLAVLPVVLLFTLFWAIGHHSKKTVDLDFGWNENVWTCRELGLRFTLPPGGEIYDSEQHDEERREKFGSRGSAGRTLLTVIDSSEGSSLGLLAIADQPSETFVLKMVTAFAESAAGEGTYELEAQEALTVGGYSWQTWRIELPEQGRVHYYLYRQSGEYSLALTASGPMAEAPPAILTCFDVETDAVLFEKDFPVGAG